MKKDRIAMLVVVLAMLAGTAAFVSARERVQKLGTPGLKVVEAPTFNPRGEVARTNSVYLPEQILDFASTNEPVTDLELSWLPPDTVFGRRAYASDDFRCAISVVLMGRDRTSIHKPQYCLIGQGWIIEKTEVEKVPIPRPYPYDLEVMKLTTSIEVRNDRGDKERLKGVYVYWFVSDTQLTAQHGERMWWMAKDLITQGILQRWAYVTYFSVCMPGAEEATFERMKQFIAASVPEFQLTSGPKLTSISPKTQTVLQEAANR